MDDGDLGDILAYLDRVEQGVSDPKPLADDIRSIMIDDNVIARTAGVDAFGRPMRPVKAHTPGQIARRGGDGPRLAPRGSASRVVAGFEVRAERLAVGSYLISGEWPALDFIVFYPEVIGLSAEAVQRIDASAGDFARDVVSGSS